MNRRSRLYADNNVAQINQFSVFNRWGGLVFDADDFAPNNESTGWDGKLKGVGVPPGVYVWIAEVEFIDGKKIVFEGNVNLMR